MPIPYDKSFGYDLDLMLDALPDGTMDRETRDAWRRLARRLPSLDGGLEIRLGESPQPADLSVLAGHLMPSSLAALAGRDAAAGLDPELAAHPAWQAVPGLAAGVLDGDSWLAGGPLDLWLEFDHATLSADVPVPCVMATRALLPGSAVLDILDNTCRALTGAAPGPGLREMAQITLDALPEQANISSVGVLSARPGQPARLRANGVPGMTTALADAFAAHWGEAAVAPVRQAAALIAPLGLYECVTLDIHESRPPRMGIPIPCITLPRAKPTEDPAMLACIAMLRDAGLCRPELAEALPRWPLWMHDPRPVGDYPYRSPGAVGAVLLRTLLQFKLAFGPEGALEAKAYLGTYRRVRHAVSA